MTCLLILLFHTLQTTHYVFREVQLYKPLMKRKDATKKTHSLETVAVTMVF
jgi:hypothetical protein